MKRVIAPMATPKHANVCATRSVLAIHTAVAYDYSQGLGVGLVQRVACAKTDATKNEVLETQKQGLKIPPDQFAASKSNPHIRSDMLAVLAALRLANKTIKTRWAAVIGPTNVVMMHGRPCKELMDIILHHIEFAPGNFKFLKAPHRSTVKQILKHINKIKTAGFKVYITMSNYQQSSIQIAAAQEAERKFRRARLDVRKRIRRAAQLESSAPAVAQSMKHTSDLPFRTRPLQ